MKRRPAVIAPVPLWPRVLLALLSPVVFVGLSELIITGTGIDYELARNKNFEIAVPVWLLANESWVAGQRPGVKAQEVEWLRHFEEARYVEVKLKPDLDVWAVNPFNEIEVAKQWKFHITTNSQGFRTQEFSPKQPSTLRIVTIGDSSTFGWGVDDDYTYQALLETRLRRAGGPQVEVYNLGIPGATSRHGLAMLKHYALDLEPDVLIIGFGSNDGRPVIRSADDTLTADEGWRGFLKHTALRFKTFRLLRRVALTVYDPVQRARQAKVPFVSNVDNDQYVRNLTEIVTTARAAGARPVLLAVCAVEEKVALMRNVVRATDVPLVDAFQIFGDNLNNLRAHRVYPDEVRFAEQLYGMDAMAKNWRLYVTSDGCHPNRAGHSLIADALADAIAKSATPQGRSEIP